MTNEKEDRAAHHGDPAPTPDSPQSHPGKPTADSNTDTPTPYADGWQTYHQLGWPSILPLPARRKKSPPKGYTGTGGARPSYADMCQWDELYPDGNIALRLPDGSVGIDVDHYGDKCGGDTITDAEKRWGRCPPRPASRAAATAYQVSASIACRPASSSAPT